MNCWNTALILCATFAYANGLACKYCLSETWEDCEEHGNNLNCTEDQTTCYVAYGLHTDGKEFPRLGVARGCGVKDSAANCLAINKTLIINESRYLEFCNGSAVYCDSDLCNTANVTTIFPEVKCKSCMGLSSEGNCTEKEEVCKPGRIHCIESTSLVSNDSDTPQRGYAKGCTYCPTIAVGCSLWNKTRQEEGQVPMRSCDIKCCSGNNCNAYKPPTEKPTATDHTTSAGPLTNGKSALGSLVAVVCFYLTLH